MRTAGASRKQAFRGSGGDHRPLRAASNAAGPDHDGGLPPHIAPADAEGLAAVVGAGVRVAAGEAVGCLSLWSDLTSEQRPRTCRRRRPFRPFERNLAGAIRTYG